LGTYGWLIGDVRAALSWAFSPHHDVLLGIELTIKSAPLLFQLSLAEEYRQHALRALAAAGDLPELSAELEFKLNIAFGYVVFHTLGLRPETGLAFKRALQLAEEAQDPAMLATAYSANWMGAYNRGEPAEMIAFAQRFEGVTLANSQLATAFMSDRMKSSAFHFLGNQRAARDCAEQSLRAPMLRTPFFMGSQIDRRVSVGTILGRVLWLQGCFGAAEQMARQTVDVAYREGESVARAFALAFCACPLAIWNGQYELARERVAELLRQTAEHSLVAWRQWGGYYQLLLVGLKDADARRDLVKRVATEEIPPQLTELLATLHPDLATETAVARGEDGRAGWCAAELLRVRALRIAETNPGAAEALLLRSMEIAKRDDALAWELRSAATLAELWMPQGRNAEALDLLAELKGRLKDQLVTPDIQHLGALLQSLRSTTAGDGS
jgi:hypothetical protein